MLVPDIFPEMSASAKSLKSHRQRQRRQGLTRVEVTVNRNDVELVRNVAKVLRDPKGAPAARSFIRMHFADSGPDFKEYLASAPLEGVDLSRPLDLGRDINL